jgi:hypothetical protein
MMRKGFSDTKLNKIMKSDYEEDLNNYLPRSLLKDLISKEDKDDSSDNIVVQQVDEEDSIFKVHDLEPIEKESYKPIRTRFHSSGNVRQFAKDYKNQFFSHFQNTITRNVPSNLNYSAQKTKEYKQEVNYNNYGQMHFDQYNFGVVNAAYKPANDTSNLSILEDFNNFLSLRPQPKRTNSSGNLESSTKSNTRSRNSLFQSSDKDDRCDDFEDIQQLLSSIDCELWIYAKSQKGSRNLQKLLNKIQPEGLDVVLEKIKSNFYELMTDTYGNYFCQKLIQCCSAEQRMFILRNVSINFNFLDYEKLYSDIL